MYQTRGARYSRPDPALSSVVRFENRDRRGGNPAGPLARRDDKTAAAHGGSMPEPRSNDRGVSSQQTQQQKAPASHPAPSRFAAVFKLDDPAERRAFDWMQRFHEPGNGLRLLDVARARAPEGQPADAIMLSECEPAPGEERPSWLVIRFELIEIRVTWRTFGLLDEARGAYSAALAIPRKPVEVAHG